MAEIRKHKPKVAGAIDQAIWTALGEDVKPVTPGRRAVDEPGQDVEPETGPVAQPLTATRLSVPTSFLTPKPQQ